MLGEPLVARADHRHDRELELARELEVALVVRGHGHDRAGAVAHQHVVGDEDRDALVVRGVDRERADEDAGLLLAPRPGVRDRSSPPRSRGSGARRRAAGRSRRTRPSTRRARCSRSRSPRSSSGHSFAVMTSTSGCSGASTMYVAPNNVSGRVVNTSISTSSWLSTGNRTDAPVERPIQLRCINLIESVQSSASRSSSRRSAYAVMRNIHCFSGRRYTGKLPRSLRPSPVTSSFASTVPRPGTPVDRRVRLVREPVRVDELALLERVEIVERDVVGSREPTGAELLHERGDRARPLAPPRRTRSCRSAGRSTASSGSTATSVVAGPRRGSWPETERAQLALHGRDVLLGGDARVRAGLHRVLLRRAGRTRRSPSRAGR